MSATPGSILPGGIVLIDEPVHVNITTFVDNGEVLMSFDCRPGGNCGQVILGLTPNMALQLIERLHVHDDVYARAIAAGKGGAKFRERGQ
jgi:hypothetical protein